PFPGSGSPSVHRHTDGFILDLKSVMKASQAISGMIILDELLKKLMEIVIENAGAQRGCLILEKDGKWFIEAEGIENSKGETTLQTTEVEESDAVCAAIVRYVARSHESVVLEDAVQKGLFVDDPYVKRNHIRSVLCMPLLNLGRLHGILYLENNLGADTFTPQRIEVLELLAGQAAIALENAALYQQAQQEIKERKQVEAALRESEQRFRTIFDSVEDAIFVHDIANGTVLDVNAGVTKMYGYTREEAFLVRMDDMSLNEPPYSVREVVEWIQKAAREGPQRFEWRAKAKDGHLFWTEVMVRLTSIGGQDRVLAMVHDISSRKQAEAEREALITSLEAQNAELERFTYTVSHDLKSPLITIRGFLGYIEQHALSGNMERLKDDLQRISAATDKMQRLLNELLELSRIGRLMNPPENIALGNLVQEVVKLLEGRLQERNVEVIVHDDLPVLYGDAQRLLEVIQNLLDNAVKFMGEQPKPVIEIGTYGEENGMPIIFVRDNGIGIAPQYHERVFGLFNKLNPNIEGTGVGLAIVKRIIEVHKGRIWVESEEGQGTTFYFTCGKGIRL
ncbi:MAG TPA: ATP-binding protein, partial [Anaerolineales bacterium]|nr:ATP-binding protein [Anaerolineales bacterium]